MKPLRLLLWAALGVPLGAGALVAQQIPSPYRYIETSQSVSAFAGYLWTGEADPDLGPDAAPIFGLRYGIRFGGPASGELSLGFAPSERTVYDNIAPEGAEVIRASQGTTSMPLLLAEAGVRFTLTGTRTWNGFAPFLLGGVGLAADLGDDGDFELDDTERFDFGPSFAVALGGGTEWFLNDRYALRLDVRDRLWRISVPDGLLQADGEDSEWTNNLSVSVGAAFHF